jgi:hypothetical protein
VRIRLDARPAASPSCAAARATSRERCAVPRRRIGHGSITRSGGSRSPGVDEERRQYHGPA